MDSFQFFVVWLLEHTFERFSHWWQQTIWMEQDCFWWARTCVNAMSGISIFAALVGISFKGIEVMPAAIGVVFCFGFFGWMFMKIAKYQEEDTLKAHMRNCANPAKDYLFYLGFIFVGLLGAPTVLTMHLLDTVDAPYAFWGVAFFWVFPYAMFFSFVACDPLPKTGKHSKLRDFLGRMRATPPRLADVTV